MRSFDQIDLDLGILSDNLRELEALLSSEPHLKERKHILPFFKERPHLIAALGLSNGSIQLPDRWARELDLFGDFAIDAAAGDSAGNAFTLVEFEDANEYSIFQQLQSGKSVKRWATRFEHGMSQLVDWAWRLSSEGESQAYRRVFGDDSPSIQLLLVVGRDADLTKDDQRRLQWRAQHIKLGPYNMTCFTFDGILASLQRRLSMATGRTDDVQ